MRTLRHALALAALAASPLPAVAQSRTGVALLRDFTFTTGERLDTLRLGWQTLGAPRRDARGRVTNAVLILHGTGGTGQQFTGPQFADTLFRPGQLLDTTRFHIILPDGIGHGRSSKPSDGLRARFPRYTYDDMVRAQHRLLTEVLGVDHLRLILGTSMGCMHAFVWGYTHPDVADGLVPLACLPTQIAGRNRMMRVMAMDAIRTDPEWRNGEYATQPRGLRSALQLLYVMSSAPLVQQRLAPTRDAADSVIRAWLDQRLAATDANDLLYQFDSSREYDPSPHLERITAPVLWINSADDFINPPELGLAERLVTRLPRGRFVLLPISERTRGHGTHTLPALWGEELRGFMRGLGER